MRDKVKIAVKSDVGMVRTENQDYYFVYEAKTDADAKARGSMVVVADGMGGHLGGTVASHTAVDAIAEIFQKSTQKSLKGMVNEAIVAANQAVRDKQQADPQIHDCGTTCVTLVLRGNLAVVGHLGDSRCYLFRGQTIERVTRDHTYLNELIDIGLLTAEQAKGHPDRNIITRCVGMSNVLNIDFNRRELKKGDVLVLCSDGLTNFVSDPEISQISRECEPDVACERLVELANKRGGEDNITIAIARVYADPVPDPEFQGLDTEEDFAPKATPVVPRTETSPASLDAEDDTPRNGAWNPGNDRTRETPAFGGSGLTTAQSIATLGGEFAGSQTAEHQRVRQMSFWIWVIGVEVLLLIVLALFGSRIL